MIVISMCAQHIIRFGKYQDKSIAELFELDCQYLLWLTGQRITAAFHIQSLEAFQWIQEHYPDTIEAAKEFVRDKCKKCFIASEQQPYCYLCQQKFGLSNATLHPKNIAMRKWEYIKTSDKKQCLLAFKR